MEQTLKFFGMIMVSATFVFSEARHQHPNTNRHIRDHGNPHQPGGIPRPHFPRMNCAHLFAGSPEWKACFDQFNEEMRTFHTRMQEYNQQFFEQIASAHENFEPLAEQSNFMQSSSQNGNHMSSFSSQGYSVKASGISISSVNKDSTISIMLAVGPFDEFQNKTEGNQITLNMKTKDGVDKFASVKLPEGVTPNDVTVERSEDAIRITGPVKSQGQHGGMSSFSSSSFAGDGFNTAI